MEVAPAVAEICQQLNGIPLAIELAAARVGTLGVGQISERLGDSLKLLTGGDRTAMPRQQTLRGTMDWSYDLLSEPEKKVFCRLSAFEGGWTLEAAEAVGAGEGIEESDILDLLSGLVNKSLVLAERALEGGMRYSMLEPIRQYAREKLEGSEEEEVVRRRHAIFFLDIAKRAAPQLKGHGQLLWLERLSTEHDDLRAAIRWLLEEGEWEMAVHLGWELYLFWWIRGHFTEGRRWMERALEKGGAAMRPSYRARALYVAGTLATGQADYPEAQELVEESRELFEEVGDEEGAALALGSAGIAAVGQERYEMGVLILEEAAGLHRKLGYDWETAAASALAAGAWLGVRDHSRAAQRAEEALVLARKVGDGTVISAALHVLATVAYASDERERAKGLFAEGLALAAEMGDAANIAYYLEGLAEVAASEDELVRAARLWGAEEALLEEIEAAAYTHRPDRSLRQSLVSAARARLDEGSWTAAWSEGRAMSPERAVEYALSAEAPALTGTGGDSRLRVHKDNSPAEGPPSDNTLTHRERQIVDLISGGHTNRQISIELSISERTVETHVHNILKKRGLTSRTQLAARMAERRELDNVS
jgi:non-specific serine/threonine protein kinase